MPINGSDCHISDLLSFRTDVSAVFYANLGMKTSFPPQRHRGDNALSQCLRTVMDVNIFESFSVFIWWELVTAGQEHLAGRQHGWNTSHDAAGLK